MNVRTKIHKKNKASGGLKLLHSTGDAIFIPENLLA